jgi:hypothetical protein
MKTTIDIADAILEQARRLASSRGTTLRALVEEGLRTLLEQGGRGDFRLRRASFRGSGLRADIAGAGWDEVRKRAFEGRGG